MARALLDLPDADRGPMRRPRAEKPLVVSIIGPVRIHRENLAAALGQVAGIDVIGTASSMEEALTRCGDGRPDIILVDVSAPPGARIVSTLANGYPGAHLVALAAPEDDESIIACAAAGVAGFVAREGTLRDIVSTARAVARGDSACPPTVTAALLRRVGSLGPQAGDQPGASQLTSRERQILSLIDEGLSNREIGGRLCIEVSTVKNHVHNILAKLGARRRSEAAAKARTRQVR
ncbi:response regulator transcription factor [Kribbella sp. NPDC004138]